MTSLLLVEDDERISGPLARMLAAEGFWVRHVATGAAALDAFAEVQPDLVVLDLTLPDIDGLEVCRRLREHDRHTPIVMLTARSDEVDVVVGLGAGADDYVAKPFRVAELVARLRARVRARDAEPGAGAAAGPGTTRTPSTATGLIVDAAARRVWMHGTELTLTPKEFDLLALLAAEVGTAVRRERIMTEVWDEHWWGSTRTLDTHVASLRRKLGDTTDPPQVITTVRGVGFRLERGALAAAPPER